MEGTVTLERDADFATGSPEERPLRRSLRRARRPSAENTMHDAFATELARSRRYERPLALIGIVSSTGARPTAKAAAALRRFVRATDTVWTSGSCVYVLLPESDECAAQVVVARLRDARSRELAPAVVNVAVFPTDALTGTALLQMAAGRMVLPTAERDAATTGASTPDALAALRAVPTSAAAS
ncbi:MAG: hypothetical protein ACJ74P_02290 [Gaiellaceae bacterium]